MSAASKPAAASSSHSHNLAEDLYWVHCNKCARQMGKVRIYLTSCGCLVCGDCGPKVIKDGNCNLCNASKVSATPIGSSLAPQHLDLFRPLSDQPSLKSITRREKFKTKHIQRGLKLHDNLGKFFKEELQRKEEERKKDQNDVENLEKQVEEKMEKLKLMEEQVRQLEENVKVHSNADGAVGGTRRKRKEVKSYPKPGAGSSVPRPRPSPPPKSSFLSF